MAVFTVAVAMGDIIKYQSFVYGSFVWEIHVRYNKIITTYSVLAIQKKYSFNPEAVMTMMKMMTDFLIII